MGIFSRKRVVQGRGERRSLPTAQNSAYSYYQNRSANDASTGRQSKKQKPKRTKPRSVQHIPTLLLVLATLTSVVYLSTVDPRPRISILSAGQKDNSPVLREESVYQNEAEQYIKGSLVNRSKFLIDTNGLQSHMRERFPELAAASVTVPIMGRRPVIELQPTRPAFILQSASGSYLVGNNGVALLKTSELRSISKLNVPTVDDQSSITISPGKSALPSEQATFISVVLEQFQKQNIEVSGLVIPTSPYDLHVKIKSKPYFIKLNILEDPVQQAGSFIVLKKTLEADGVEPREYIDVRAGERVFYR